MTETKYNSSKIYKEVIIVENEYHQGYLVEKGNEKMLQSAHEWAEGWSRKKTASEYEYENGHFELELQYSANGSYSQGGKLSFWNCNIKAPDGKVFLIGINADQLIKLLRYSTFIKGKCQDKLWLGRVKNQVCAFTETMDEYKQAMADEKLRTDVKSKTSVYEEGTVIGNLTDKEVYAGLFNNYLKVDVVQDGYYIHETSNRWSSWYKKPKYNITVTVLKNPVQKHVYVGEKPQYYFGGNVMSIIWDVYYNRKAYWSNSNIRDKRKPSHVFDKVENIDFGQKVLNSLNGNIKNRKKYLEEHPDWCENKYFEYCITKYALIKDELTESNKQKLINAINDYIDHLSKHYYNNYFNFKLEIE